MGGAERFLNDETKEEYPTYISEKLNNLLIEMIAKYEWSNLYQIYLSL